MSFIKSDCTNERLLGYHDALKDIIRQHEIGKLLTIEDVVEWAKADLGPAKHPITLYELIRNKTKNGQLS